MRRIKQAHQRHEIIMNFLWPKSKPYMPFSVYNVQRSVHYNGK
jgi:hypothetical protein